MFTADSRSYSPGRRTTKHPFLTSSYPGPPNPSSPSPQHENLHPPPKQPVMPSTETHHGYKHSSHRGNQHPSHHGNQHPSQHGNQHSSHHGNRHSSHHGNQHFSHLGNQKTSLHGYRESSHHDHSSRNGKEYFSHYGSQHPSQQDNQLEDKQPTSWDFTDSEPSNHGYFNLQASPAEPGQGQSQGHGQQADPVFSPDNQFDLHDPAVKDTDNEGRFQFHRQTEHHGALAPESAGEIPLPLQGNFLHLPSTSSLSAGMDTIPLPGSSQLSALTSTLSFPKNSPYNFPFPQSSQLSPPTNTLSVPGNSRDPVPCSGTSPRADPLPHLRSFRHSPQVDPLVVSGSLQHSTLEDNSKDNSESFTRRVNDHNYHDVIDENSNDNYNLDDSGPILSTGYEDEMRTNHGFKIENNHDNHGYKIKRDGLKKKQYDFKINRKFVSLHGSDHFQESKNPFDVKRSAEWDQFFSSILSQAKRHQNQHFPPDVSDIVERSHDWSGGFMAGNSRSRSADQRPKFDEIKYKSSNEYPKINNFEPYTENSFYVNRKYDDNNFPFKKKKENFKLGVDSKFFDEPNKVYFGDKFNYIDKFIKKNNISLSNSDDKHVFDSKIPNYFKLPWSTFNYKRSFSSLNPNDVFSQKEYLKDNLYSKDVTLDDHSYTKKVFERQKTFNLNNNEILTPNNKNLNFSNLDLVKNNKRMESDGNLKIYLSEKLSHNKKKLNNSNNYFAKIFWNSKYSINNDKDRNYVQPKTFPKRIKASLNNGKINGNYMNTNDGQLSSGKRVAHLRINSRLQLSHRRRPGPRQHSRTKPKNYTQFGQLFQSPEAGQGVLPESRSIMSRPDMNIIRINQTAQKHNYHKNIFKSTNEKNNSNFHDKRNVLSTRDLNRKITNIKGKFKQNLLNVTHNPKNNMSTNVRQSGRKSSGVKHLRFSRAFFTAGGKRNQGHVPRKDGQHRSTPTYLNDYPVPHPLLPPSSPINLKGALGHDELHSPVEGDIRNHPPPDGDSMSSDRAAPVGGNTYHALAPPGSVKYHKPDNPVPACHGKYSVSCFDHCWRNKRIFARFTFEFSRNTQS